MAAVKIAPCGAFNGFLTEKHLYGLLRVTGNLPALPRSCAAGFFGIRFFIVTFAE